MSGFERTAIDETIEEWSKVESYNECLERLLKRRETEIVATGDLLESKTAWKCAVLQQSLLYRVTALASGCTAMWNEGNVVCSILAGRALVETIALSYHMRQELEKLVPVKDANAIDDLMNEHLFATKNNQIVEDGYGYLAKSILTYIDRFDKKINGVRKTYEFLSEWAHPNGSGHLFTYGEIDKITGKVTFYDAAPRVRGIQVHVITCVMLIRFMELIMDTFDEAIPILAEIDKGQGPWLLSPGTTTAKK